MKRIALFFTLAAGIAFSVFGQNTSDFEYEVNNNQITITGYNGNVGNVRIPERINNLPVTRIGEGAFSENQLASVAISNSVTHIGNTAFYKNQLTGISIPNSVTYIGEGAFAENQLTSITIPNSVTFIGNNAFVDNQLTRIILPDNVNIEPNAFNYISVYAKYTREGKRRATFNISLSVSNEYEIAILDNSVVEIMKYTGRNKNVTIPARINNLPVAAIGAGAYYYNRLTGITIPNSVTHIGFWAFIGNQLTSVIIPNTVIFIADNAFDDNVRIIRR